MILTEPRLEPLSDEQLNDDTRVRLKPPLPAQAGTLNAAANALGFLHATTVRKHFS